MTGDGATLTNRCLSMAPPTGARTFPLPHNPPHTLSVESNPSYPPHQRRLPIASPAKASHLATPAAALIAGPRRACRRIDPVLPRPSTSPIPLRDSRCHQSLPRPSLLPPRCPLRRPVGQWDLMDTMVPSQMSRSTTMDTGTAAPMCIVPRACATMVSFGILATISSCASMLFPIFAHASHCYLS